MITEWQLDRHFYDDHTDPRIMQDVAAYQEDVGLFVAKYKGRLSGLSDEEFLAYLNEAESTGKESEKISMYLSLISSLHSQDQDLQKTMQRLSRISSDCEDKMTFVDEEFKKIGYERFMAMSEQEMFAPFKNFLVSEADSLKHMLSEIEEKLLIKVDQASEENLYEELYSSFEFDFRGEKMTSEEVWALKENSDRSKRLDACGAIAAVFGKKENQVVFGNLYSLVCKESVFNKEVRGYPTVMSQRNMSEELSDATVDVLIHIVKKAYPMYHAFLREKKRILGIVDFSIHDVFAPMDASDRNMTFEEGWGLFMNMIRDVDPAMHDFAEEMLEDGRISVYPYKGKVAGAYASYVHGTKEFMLLNWTDTVSDVTTLAHEMGHCFHGMLSKKQRSLVYSTPMTLAETASIFSETLMFDRLVQGDIEEKSRRSMVMQRLDDIFATIVRQIAYVSFERRCHESFDRNEPLTFDDYNAMWMEEMAELYGPDVIIDPALMEFSWSCIPHIFHTPFYCYTYAFGNIISLNLVEQYRKADDKKAFLSKYHEFLAAGGSERPEDLLMKTFGLVMNADFYETAFGAIRDLMKDIETVA